MLNYQCCKNEYTFTLHHHIQQALPLSGHLGKRKFIQDATNDFILHIQKNENSRKAEEKDKNKNHP